VVKEERKIHLAQARTERQYYHSKRLEAKQRPDDVLSLIIDGMDQVRDLSPASDETCLSSP